VFANPVASGVEKSGSYTDSRRALSLLQSSRSSEREEEGNVHNPLSRWQAFFLLLMMIVFK
jgi:hypothetical protein